MKNCFACLGKDKECVKNGRYIRGDDGDCRYYVMVKEDLDKLNKRDFQKINLRDMLAQYLSSKGDTRTLEVLT